VTTDDARRWPVHRFNLGRSGGEHAELLSGIAPDLVSGPVFGAEGRAAVPRGVAADFGLQ
ncbi:hypothetical protein ACFWP3_41985, partial [Streptomyces sp. NPDC058525]|uniref:hypothetical protein n=1 Tax=Streptomyces sp. NPDC058525 TaxID=3346538 RepID=UPI00365B26F7